MVLGRYFGERAAARMKKVVHFSQGVVDALERYTWPGNVRELESVIEYAFSRCNSTVLLSDLPSSLREDLGQRTPGRLFAAIARVEDVIEVNSFIDQYILHVLALYDGNKSRAAAKLGIHRETIGNVEDRAAKGETVKYLHTFIGKSRRKDGEAEVDSQSSLFEDAEESLVGPAAQ
jgi:DNA-binding NtrC family response regulator